MRLWNVVIAGPVRVSVRFVPAVWPMVDARVALGGLARQPVRQGDVQSED